MSDVDELKLRESERLLIKDCLREVLNKRSKLTPRLMTQFEAAIFKINEELASGRERSLITEPGHCECGCREWRMYG